LLDNSLCSAGCGRWLVLICCEKKILLAGWWLVLIWYKKKTLLAGCSEQTEYSQSYFFSPSSLA